MFLRLLRRPHLVVIAWLLCWVVILTAGLWPLRFHVPNDVKWLKSENGLAFDGNGEVYCSRSLKDMIGNASQAGEQPFSLELLVRPRGQGQPNVAYIVSDNLAGSQPGCILLQYGSILILQSHFWGVSGPHKLGVGGVLTPGQLVHVAVVSGRQGTKLYVNGLLRESFGHPVAVEKFTGSLVIGNSGRPDYGWTGDLLGLAAYDRERSSQEIQHDAAAWKARQPDPSGAVAFYLFAEESGEWASSTTGHGAPLHIPRHLVILHRSVLAWDFMPSRAFLWDMTENLTGFMPFGFLGAAVFARRCSLRTSLPLAVLVGFGLSLGIEVTQAWIPFRDSSSVDLAMNTLGTAIGAGLLAAVEARYHSLA